MADRGGKNQAKRVTRAAAADAAASPAPPSPAPGGGFDVQSIIGIADILPVMICTLDRDLRYRFVNRPYADWFERPRSAILGRTLAEVIGEEAAQFRAPMIAAMLAGENQYFVTDYDHPTRGPPDCGFDARVLLRRVRHSA